MDDSMMVQSLVGVPLFSQLDKRSLKKLAGLCVARSFGEGESLMREGDVGLGLYVVTAGLVRVLKGEGEEEIELARIGEGGVIGEMALIDDHLRSASVVAMEATETVLLSRESFSSLAHKDPEIAWCIVPELTERVREMDRRQLELESELSARVNREEPSRPVEGPSKEKRSKTSRRRDQRQWMEHSALQLLRLQCALGVGAVEGFAGAMRISQRFVTTLADETELNESSHIRDILVKFPGGLLAATRSAIRESEKLPGTAADRVRRFLESN